MRTVVQCLNLSRWCCRFVIVTLFCQTMYPKYTLGVMLKYLFFNCIMYSRITWYLWYTFARFFTKCYGATPYVPRRTGVYQVSGVGVLNEADLIQIYNSLLNTLCVCLPWLGLSSSYLGPHHTVTVRTIVCRLWIVNGFDFADSWSVGSMRPNTSQRGLMYISEDLLLAASMDDRSSELVLCLQYQFCWCYGASS